MGAKGGVNRERAPAPATVLAIVATVLLAIPVPGAPAPGSALGRGDATSTPSGPVANFTAALNRLVELVGLAGSAILTLVWARVALSWFSNDLTKKIQAKDRARDALIGTLLFVAAVSGLVWGLAHWVVTGT